MGFINFKMATATKLVEPRGANLSPALKDWIDRMIVPALVKEFLDAQREKPCLVFGQVAHSAASTSVPAEGVRQ